MNNEKFKNALNKFVEQQKQDPNVIGIIVSGSYIHSVPDKNSDLDVYVLLNESEMRERGNTWIDDVEIEYFINPIKQVRKYFETEIGDKAPCTAHMFANSEIQYQKGSALQDLIDEAKNILSRPQKQMGSVEIELAKYFIDDMQKDLEDVFIRKDIFAFSLVSNEIISKSLQIFLGLKGVQKEKNKRLADQLEKVDPEYAVVFFLAVKETDIEKKFHLLNKLVTYTENLLGGKRPKEWKLKSECTA